MKRILCIGFPNPLEASLLRDLAVWCERFSPLVGVEGADSLALDVTGLPRIFGGEETLCRQALAALQERGYAASAGLADTLGAAWGVAHAACGSSATIVLPGETVAALGPLPLAALRLSEPILILLAELGLQRIEQLLALPRRELPCRFGQELLWRLEQALGEREELIQPVRPLPDWTVVWLLEYPLTSWTGMEQILMRLLERLCGELALQERGVVRLVCRLRCQNRETVATEVGLFRPTASPRHLAELVQLRWERVRLPGPVEGIEVQATQIAPLAERQTELFGSDTRQQPLALAQLVDRLQSRLGAKALKRPRLLADAQPERAYRYAVISGDNPPRRSVAKTAVTPPSPLRRPLYLWPRPEPVRMVAVAPDGPPQMFLLDQEQHRIVRHWGPERIETGWWRGRSIRRDYYRVETDDAAWWWLFRDLHTGQWFLHGEFG